MESLRNPQSDARQSYPPISATWVLRENEKIKKKQWGVGGGSEVGERLILLGFLEMNGVD